MRTCAGCALTRAGVCWRVLTCADADTAQVPPSTFDGNGALAYANLKGNTIATFPRRLFAHSANTLASINNDYNRTSYGSLLQRTKCGVRFILHVFEGPGYGLRA